MLIFIRAKDPQNSHPRTPAPHNPEREQPAPTIQAIRSSTHTGRPAGDEKFLLDLEKQLDFTIRPQPVGRPRVAGKGDVR